MQIIIISLENIKNRLIVEKDGCWSFKNNYSLVQLKINLIPLSISSDLLEKLEKILDYSLKNIHKISSAEAISFHQEQISRAIGGIKSITLEFSHKEKFSIFNFVARLFIRLLMGHYLTNGNKRLATAFLYEILWAFGYMFYWSSDYWMTQKMNENKITYFATRAQGGKALVILSEVTEWIKKRIFIKLPLGNRTF